MQFSNPDTGRFKVNLYTVYCNISYAIQLTYFHYRSEIFKNNIRTTQSKWMGLTADIALLRMKIHTEFVLEYLKERDNLVDVGVDVRLLVREVLGKKGMIM